MGQLAVEIEERNKRRLSLITDIIIVLVVIVIDRKRRNAYHLYWR